jgi:CRP-like cAMP-binding protein
MTEELKRIPLFCETDHKVLERLIRERKIYKGSYRKGVTVHEQNTGCSAVDVVCSGKLVAYSLTANGSESLVFEFETGSIIGANLLFGGRNLYPMNIYCTADCVLCRLKIRR